MACVGQLIVQNQLFHEQCSTNRISDLDALIKASNIIISSANQAFVAVADIFFLTFITGVGHRPVKLLVILTLND